MIHEATAATALRERGTRPLVLAHRGASDQAPQNSLAAVNRAIELGCDGIEIDVRRTADGHLVVVHDSQVRRRAVRRLTHEEVKARMAPGQAPLLSDLLDAAAGRLLVDVELKEDGYVEEAVALVAQHLPAGSFVITSFLPTALAQVKRHRAEIRTGLLVAPGAARQAPRRMRETGADFLLPHVTLLRTGIVESAAEAGLASWVWTVNDGATMEALADDPHVAALITDEPARAVATFTSC
ncbi:MAG TPA: glycerophosphodiester phosphodiesterase [Solirubrobacteraceae bacterium]|nr:glycerophosphodiester phosphodiesterase [Solirubrobacteraceae bacterium]